MPHVAFVPFSGLRVGESELLEFGMRLPGLRQRAEALAELPSLGMLTLAGMMPPGWTSSYHPSESTATLIDDVLESQPTIVAVSALTASILEAYRFCDRLRDAGVSTVIGGLHVTALPDEAARHATAVCVGDGESSWHRILEDACAGTLQSIYRPARQFDLANSPMPRFDLLGNRPLPRWTLQTQRGCPWACEFCAASRLLGPPRYKPVDRIGKELDAIKRLDHSPWIELADDNTFAGREDSIALLRRIGEADVRYFTESDWRIAEQPMLVAELARSGCVQVLVGIESLAFQYPGMGRKQADLRQVMDAVQVIQDAGIVVNGCFIVGANDETDESLDRLIDFIARCPLAEIQLTIQTPFPGTALYRRMRRAGRLRPACDWSHYTLFDVAYEPTRMSATELEIGFRRVMSAVFSDDQARRRSQIRKEIWSTHRSMRQGES